MYNRRKHKLRRIEHTRVQHEQRTARQEHLERHVMQMHLARITR